MLANTGCTTGPGAGRRRLTVRRRAGRRAIRATRGWRAAARPPCSASSAAGGSGPARDGRRRVFEVLQGRVAEQHAGHGRGSQREAQGCLDQALRISAADDPLELAGARHVARIVGPRGDGLDRGHGQRVPIELAAEGPAASTRMTMTPTPCSRAGPSRPRKSWRGKPRGHGHARARVEQVVADLRGVEGARAQRAMEGVGLPQGRDAVEADLPLLLQAAGVRPRRRRGARTRVIVRSSGPEVMRLWSCKRSTRSSFRRAGSPPGSAPRPPRRRRDPTAPGETWCPRTRPA